MSAPAVKATNTRPWLDRRSPIHVELDWLWEQNEARFEGGHNVREELWRFDWETRPINVRGQLRDGVTIPVANASVKANGKSLKDSYITSSSELAPGEHYMRRQDAAIYVNLMDAFATDIVGHLFQQGAPSPSAGLDFGLLGEVRRLEDIDEPTLAELIYYNTDGVGSDGSQWDSFWSSEMKLAMATGYRWIYVEAPAEPAGLLVRERLGFRPYLVSFSPRQVINYLYRQGQLQWAIVKIATRNPTVVNGEFSINDNEAETLVLVKRGVTNLGTDFEKGGWWRFDPDGDFVFENGVQATGNFDRTNGEIPMAPLIYDRHRRILGRPGLTELGNASIALMNIDSAASFDAWDSAGSVKAVRGADPKSFNIFIEKVREGNRFAPLPMNMESEKPQTPDIQDASQGQVVADVFDKRIRNILQSADRIRGIETTSGPQASGLAQQAGFSLGNVPRLSLVAGNIETCQNAIIQWLEQRSRKGTPRGVAHWGRKFELVKLTNSAQAILQLESIAGINSEELEATVIVEAAQDEGFITDNAKRTTIENQLRESRRTKDKQAQTAADAKNRPQVPGARSRAAPPEPAQTNQDVKTQMDGPNVE